MLTDSLPPFAVPGSSDIEPDHWLIEIDGRVERLPKRLDDWDYATPIDIHRDLAIARRGILNTIDAGPEASLAVSVLVETTNTRIRRQVAQVQCAEDIVSIGARVSPNELGGVLSIRTLLTIATPDPRGPLSPSRPGSILWSDNHKLVLEGAASRFPLELVSFEKTGNPTKAPWRIDFYDSDLEVPAVSAVRVLVNSDHQRARQMAENPEKNGETRILAESLESDIARRMLSLAVENSDLLDGSEFPSGSLGEALGYFVQAHFPLENMTSLRSTYGSDPGRLEAEMLGSLQSFGS